MKDRRGWWTVWGAVLGTPVLLFGLYAEEYYRCMEMVPEMWHQAYFVPMYTKKPLGIYPGYPGGFFEPMYQIDRRLRWNKWETLPEYRTGSGRSPITPIVPWEYDAATDSP